MLAGLVYSNFTQTSCLSTGTPSVLQYYDNIYVKMCLETSALEVSEVNGPLNLGTVRLNVL